ncbi:enoyl-CoA hydratase/isomerase family protein [Angustibacter sp. McL0619]|uniref:enoyl-CoA hydratase/isomerase family protein n=1 Tax=Angustibacter sp. McL0619 TaxID=3415676 RepID=UPI003CF0EE5C
MSQTVDAPVEYEVQDAVAVVRLRRPEAMNSLDRATKVALLEALRTAGEDDEVRCVVLTGSGRAFSAGQDLREHVADLRAANAAGSGSGGAAGSAGSAGSAGFALGGTVREHYNPIATLIATMAKPVIASVNGVAAGAGASFAFAADVRLVGASAGFNLAFSAIALSCDSGASWWLPRLVGVAKAKDLLLFPRTVGAQEALELGLATRVVPDEELEAATTELARTLAAGPTLAYASIRRAIAFSQSHDLEQSLANEADLMDLTGRSQDHAGAVEAFVAKQRPTFIGR